MSKEYKNLIFSGLLAVVSVLYLIGAWNVKLGSLSSAEGRLIPIIAGVLLLCLCVIEIVTSLQAVIPEKAPFRFLESMNELRKNRSLRRVAVTFVLIAGYVVLLPSLGFPLVTFLYLFLQMFILADNDKKKIPLFLLVSLLCTSSIYYVFVHVFELMLPPGLLG